jgi:hypothetical protein
MCLLLQNISAASGASPQNQVYVRFMSMFVIIYVYMSFGFHSSVFFIVFHTVCKHMYFVQRDVLGFMVMLLIYCYPTLYYLLMSLNSMSLSTIMIISLVCTITSFFFEI